MEVLEAGWNPPAQIRGGFKVADLKLPRRVQGVLRRGGIELIETLYEMSATQLANIPRMGPKYLTQLNIALVENGRTPLDISAASLRLECLRRNRKQTELNSRLRDLEEEMRCKAGRNYYANLPS